VRREGKQGSIAKRWSRRTRSPVEVDLTKLEQHLATRSYVEGYTPSQADVLVFKAISSPPSGANLHVARWYSHIKSYAAEHGSLAGSSTAGEAFIGKAAEAAPAPAPEEEEEEVDLFGEDEEEDAEAERVKAERIAAYNSKKANKPKTVAKSVVTMDVKPWDDETDMVALEKAVRSIEQDGLVWGSSKLVAIGYGIKKLQITLVVEDEKVSTDELQEKITDFDDYVQSTDIAAMQKL
jgi:elongation factor 1-beta